MLDITEVATPETSMSMSLAEGIIRRGLRELREAQYTSYDVFRNFHKQAPTKRKQRLKFIRDQVDKSCCIPVCVYHVSNNQTEIWFVEPSETEQKLVLGCFELSRYGLAVAHDVLHISLHAMARIIFRTKIRDIVDAVGEMFGNVRTRADFPLLLLQKDGDETYMQTKNGMSILKQVENGEHHIVTWVSSDQQYEVQKQVNKDGFDMLNRLVQQEGYTTMREYFENDKDFATAMLADMRSWGKDVNDVEELITLFELGLAGKVK